MNDHGTYIGPIKRLQGHTALLRYETTDGGVLAQFDDLKRLSGVSLALSLAHGWHKFASCDFSIDQPRKKDAGHIARMYGGGFIMRLGRIEWPKFDYADIEARALASCSHDPRNHFGKYALRIG